MVGVLNLLKLQMHAIGKRMKPADGPKRVTTANLELVEVIVFVGCFRAHDFIGFFRIESEGALNP